MSEITDELEQKLDAELLELLKDRDAAAKLLTRLPRAYSPEQVARPTDEQRAWELLGLHFRAEGRPYEAIAILSSLYRQMLAGQAQLDRWIHKGMPLVWISDVYSGLGFPVLAKRFLMLTLCEDALREHGAISAETTGVYFRLVWAHGVSDAETRRYASEFWRLHEEDPSSARFPEWLLQHVDQGWVAEIPSPREALIYVTNETYVRHLMAKLGEGTGSALEELAEYLVSCMPGCRTTRRQTSHSTDYDLVCGVEGLELDFRSELGRYFVCECKDWSVPADFSTMAKFCRVLDSTKARFGILFSRRGISGEETTQFAAREQVKVFQDRGIVIVVMDEGDLESVAKGANLIQLLKRKYEEVRLDLRRL